MDSWVPKWIFICQNGFVDAKMDSHVPCCPGRVLYSRLGAEQLQLGLPSLFLVVWNSCTCGSVMLDVDHAPTKHLEASEACTLWLHDLDYAPTKLEASEAQGTMQPPRP